MDISFDAARAKVSALTDPRNVVLVGASDRSGSWAPRVWHSLQRSAFPRRVFPMNPSRRELWGAPCYADFAALPEPPDHLVVLVPAAAVPDVLARGAAAGARSATIFSAGFGEAGDPEGLAHGPRLRAVIEETGLAVSGPNCMGNICAKSRLVTLVEERAHAMHPGPVALVRQSGGVMMFLNHTLEERALWAVARAGAAPGCAPPEAGPRALDEVQSKRLLAAYGILAPQEQQVTNAADAVAAAEHLGYPVVLKAVSARLPHKSDAGAVMLDLRTADAVRAAYDRIMENLARHGLSDALDGVLVCRQVKADLELAIGLHRDPEMGPVIMVGAGGVLIELINDVALGAPPITRAKARDMLAQTRVAALLTGVRGGPALDADAVVDALVALGAMASDLANEVEAIDINPFAALPAGQGGLALAGLVVLRAPAVTTE